MRSTRVCSCHGVPMMWHAGYRDRRSGGTWRCRVKWLEAQHRHDARRAFDRMTYDMRRAAAERVQRLKEMNGPEG